MYMKRMDDAGAGGVGGVVLIKTQSTRCAATSPIDKEKEKETTTLPLLSPGSRLQSTTAVAKRFIGKIDK